MANFLSPLQLEYIDGTKWRLIAPFEYHLGAPDGPDHVHLPVGFITDFASIPRMFWPVMLPTGLYGKAAVVHDWLYQEREVERHVGHATLLRLVTRLEADDVLKEAMGVLSVRLWTIWTIYLGVRAGGWLTWNRYRANDPHS